MRIAHVVRRLSFEDWGGTEQTVWNLAKAQAKAGHETRIFATTALCGKRQETVDGIEIVRFKPIYPWWPMPKSLVDELDRKGGNPFVPGLGKALREWKPDVIHCHAMARIAELCLRTAKGLKAQAGRQQAYDNKGGRPKHSNTRTLKPFSPVCVISLHGGGANVPGAEAKSLKAPTRGRLPWGKAIDILMGWTRRVPEDFDGIVCVGEDEYEKYRTVHPHVMYLPNGVDCSLFKGRETRDDERYAAGRPLRLLCVARIDRQKNQMMLVEALARHPGMELCLAGPVTQPDYRAEIESRAAALGVSSRVTFTGALKPGSPELLGEFAKADVFALASRHEPFGIAVLEAWAAGLPVAASGVGGLGRLCAAHPGAAEVFAPDDAASLDAALAAIKARLAADGARGMKEAGAAAAAEYDWAVLAERLGKFMESIPPGRAAESD